MTTNESRWDKIVADHGERNHLIISAMGNAYTTVAERHGRVPADGGDELWDELFGLAIDGFELLSDLG